MYTHIHTIRLLLTWSWHDRCGERLATHRTSSIQTNATMRHDNISTTIALPTILSKPLNIIYYYYVSIIVHLLFVVVAMFRRQGSDNDDSNHTANLCTHLSLYLSLSLSIYIYMHIYI